MPLLQSISAFDRTVSQPLAPLRKTAAVRTLGGASDIAKDGRWMICCAVVAGVGMVRRDERLIELGAGLLAASKAGFVAKNALKNRVVRTRPYVVDDGRPYRFGSGFADTAALNAFPSGHSAAGMVSAILVSAAYPRARTVAWIGGGFLAAIQLPRRHHYPTDVAVGLAIGLGAGAACAYIMRARRLNSSTSVPDTISATITAEKRMS